MDLRKTVTYGLSGAAAILAGGPVGMIVGLLAGGAPNLIAMFVPHLIGSHDVVVTAPVAQAMRRQRGQFSRPRRMLLGCSRMPEWIFS